MLIVHYGKMSFSLFSPFPPSFFDRFSQKTIPCTVSCSEQCSCSWDIGQQRICNITVTVENPLGKKTATDVFDVTHRSKVFSMSLLRIFCCRPCPPSDLNTRVPQFKVWKSLIFIFTVFISYLSLCYSYLLSSVSALQSCVNGRKQLHSKG